MNRFNSLHNPNGLPEYSDTMYLQGYEPWQIYEAFHRTMREQFQEQADDYNVNMNVKIEE